MKRPGVNWLVKWKSFIPVRQPTRSIVIMITKILKKVKGSSKLTRIILVKLAVILVVIYMVVIGLKRNLEPQEMEAFRLWVKSPKARLLIKFYLLFTAGVVYLTFPAFFNKALKKVRPFLGALRKK